MNDNTLVRFDVGKVNKFNVGLTAFISTLLVIQAFISSGVSYGLSVAKMSSINEQSNNLRSILEK